MCSGSKETDEQGYTNAWKDSAARSIQTIREAMEKKAITDYDDTTARMRDIGDTMGGHYPGSDSQQPVRLRRPDGTYETITVQELNRRRQAELRKQVEERTAKHEDGVKRIGEDVGSNLSKHCDMKAVTDFNKVHKEQLDKRDVRMNLIAEDLVHWLNADGLTDRALDLYSETAAPEREMATVAQGSCARSCCNSITARAAGRGMGRSIRSHRTRRIWCGGC